MGRLGSALLVLALLAGVVWASRQAQSGNNGAAAAPSTAVLDANWVKSNELPLRRVLNLIPNLKLEFKEAVPSPMPDHYAVLLDAIVGEERVPLTLTVSRDGRRLLYEGWVYDLSDPFGAVRNYISLDNVPSRGPADAPVVIVEYTDFTCVYCRQFFLALEKPLFERYGGKVRYVYKHFPLTGLRSWSEDAALGAACAFRQGNENFWAYHEKLFQEAQRLNAGRDVLVELAQQVGLQQGKFERCVDQKETQAEVNHDLREGERLGVNGTPNFFINGRRITGLPRPAFLFEIIEQELAAAQQP